MKKKVLIIINIYKDESMSLAKEIATYLKDKGVESEFLSFDGFCDNTPFESYSFVITLGGDGTVLFAARNCVNYDVPVFPVNLGQFGFIATIQTDEWKKELDLYLKGKYVIQKRSLIQAELYRNNQLVVSSIGLNDIVISAKNTARTVALSVKSNGIHLCNLKSDGVIFSTSTGSTAYSASAGGPIIDPVLDVIVMTPINPFSLSSRPIVLSTEEEIEVLIQPCRTKEISLIVDGQEGISLASGDVLKIKQFKKKIQLINCTTEKYYNALRAKMNWTGGPHA